MNYRGIIRITVPAVALVAATALAGGVAFAATPTANHLDGGPSWSDQLGATTWYTYPTTNLKDPTPAHTVTLDCGAQKTDGTALYPYIVTDGPQSYDYAYHNLSTKSVYVASDGFGHSGDANGYLTVGNRNIHGDYDFSAGYECSANNTDNPTFIQSATATNVAATSADVDTTYYNNGLGNGAPGLYEVQYGPAAGDYTHTVVLPDSTLVDNDQYGTLIAQLTGLQPGTTYHYRAVQNAAGPGDLKSPNFSADQTFTTAAA